MDDLMLHVLDLAMNGVAAGAPTVKIGLWTDLAAGRLRLTVADNGPGMTADLVHRVLTEYATTKTKAKGWVGFGLALLRGTCDLVDGSFHLTSRPGLGTLVCCDLPVHHPDLPPLGAVAESMQSLYYGCGGTAVCFTRRVDQAGYRVDARTVRRVVGDAYDSPMVKRWLVDQVRDGEARLASGREHS